MIVFFAILCFDKPGVGELREKTRAAHLEYLKEHKSAIHLGGRSRMMRAASSAHYLSSMLRVIELH